MVKCEVYIKDVEIGMVLAQPINVTSNGQDMLIARPGTEITERILKYIKRNKMETLEVYTHNPPETTVTIKKTEPIIPSHTSPPPHPKLIRFDPHDSSTYANLRRKVSTLTHSCIDEVKHKQVVSSMTQMFSVMMEPGKGFSDATTAYGYIREFEIVIQDLAVTIKSDRTGLNYILDLKTYDEYTFHHSLSVAMLSLAIGDGLGYNLEQLKELARCAMLHDVGKQKIPESIINKPGKLTPEERKTVEEHAKLGADLLKAKGYGNQNMWNIIQFHHEKYGGGGYPKGLFDKEIPMYSRIISVADVYDALTSYRPYRKPLPPCEAFKIIAKDSGTAFDPDVVNAFQEKIILYPVNTMVILSDGRAGHVVSNDSSTRPIVKIWKTDEIVDLYDKTNDTIFIEEIILKEPD